MWWADIVAFRDTDSNRLVPEEGALHRFTSQITSEMQGVATQVPTTNFLLFIILEFRLE